MIGQWFKDRKGRRETARALYFAAANHARHPGFYQEMGVPDTVDGRFEMTALHVFLLMHLLGPEHGKLSQALFDRMFKVTDQSMRQAGIGDLSVPRHMKRMMTAFNGRAHAYAKALTAGEGMEDALRRNVYGTLSEMPPGGPESLAQYMRGALKALTVEAVAQGRADFPMPTTFVLPEQERRHA